MSTEKTLRLYETFESHAEFQATLRKYCQETNQVFTLVDSKLLKPKDSSKEELDLVKKFVYKAQKFDCVLGRKRNRGYLKKGVRKNKTSQKIGCECQFRINFNVTKNLFEITSFITEHNHPIDADFFKNHARDRKPSEDQMKKMLELHEKFSVKVSTLVSKFNEENNTSLTSKDFHNFNQKMK
jgi:hypothetical protein